MKPVGVRLALVSVALLGLSACGGGGSGGATGTPSASAPTLSSTGWVLRSVAGPDGPVPAVDDVTASLRFAADGGVSGSTGCNRFAGTYTQDGASLSVALGPMTLMACTSPGAQTQEASVLAGLAATRSVAGTTDGGIELRDGTGGAVLTYGPAVSELPGTSWRATGINNGAGAVVSDATTGVVTAEFGGDGSVSGSAGCNTYSGAYTTSGPGEVSVGPLATTKKKCDADVMATEARYLAALQRATTYEIDGTTMTLRDDSGAAQVVFRQE